MGTLKLFDLSGKTAIVTGGGRGLGLALAEALAEAGCDLMLCSRKAVNCEEAARKLEQLGVTAIGKKCDITDSSDVTELRDAALKTFGKIDILINNSRCCLGRADGRLSPRRLAERYQCQRYRYVFVLSNHR